MGKAADIDGDIAVGMDTEVGTAQPALACAVAFGLVDTTAVDQEGKADIVGMEDTVDTVGMEDTVGIVGIVDTVDTVPLRLLSLFHFLNMIFFRDGILISQLSSLA